MFNHEDITLHWVNRLGFVVRKDLARRFRDAGLDVTTEEWAILLILWKSGEQTPGAIADVTFRDRTTVTRLIDGMVRKGLVERGADPDDRRKSILRPGALGRSLQKDLVPIARDLVAKAQAGIDPDAIETTLATLRKMTDNLLAQGDPDRPEGGPP